MIKIKKGFVENYTQLIETFSGLCYSFPNCCKYCRTFINANSITVKFDNCKETYWTQIGTNVNQWELIENLITAIANEFRQTNY